MLLIESRALSKANYVTSKIRYIGYWVHKIQKFDFVTPVAPGHHRSYNAKKIYVNLLQQTLLQTHIFRWTSGEENE